MQLTSPSATGAGVRSPRPKWDDSLEMQRHLWAEACNRAEERKTEIVAEVSRRFRPFHLSEVS